MIILQAGVPRSGNLWVYRTIQHMLMDGNIPIKSYAAEYRKFIARHSIHDLNQTFTHDVINIKPEGLFWEPSHLSSLHIHDIDAYLQACTHIWSHSHFIDDFFNVYTKFSHIFYILRDPRDVLISNARYLYTEKMQTYRPNQHARDPQEFLEQRHFAVVHNWVRHVGGYLKQYDRLNMHFIFYENMLADFESELAALQNFLGLSLSGQESQIIKEAVSFSTMHEEKPDHVNKGQAGQWLNVLTDDQINAINRVAGPMLALLGYSLTGTQAQLPKLIQGGFSPADIEYILNQAEEERLSLNRLAVKSKNKHS
jgi:aryl sulfotransferase